MDNKATVGTTPAEREQLLLMIRGIIAEAEDMFTQQQKFLKLSYSELNCAVERLRYKVQYSNTGNLHHHSGSGLNGMLSDRAPPPPQQQQQHMTPNPKDKNNAYAMNTAMMSSTPLRTNGMPGPATTTANNRLLGGLSAGGNLSNLAGNHSNPNSHMGMLSGNGPRMNGTSTPPNRNLMMASGDERGLSVPQSEDQFRSDWGSLSVANQLRDGNANNLTKNGNEDNNNNNNHNNNNAMLNSANTMLIESMMASPQATSKMPLEDLLSRFSQNEPSPALNWDSIYEQLLQGGMDDSPTDNGNNRKDDPHARGRAGLASHSTNNEAGGATTTLFANGLGGGEGGERTSSPPPCSRGSSKDFYPVEKLPPIHERHLTTSVRAYYENGRPHVAPIEGGEPEHPEAYGVDLQGSCQVLIEFKGKRMIQYDSSTFVKPGTFVIVGGDRGEDLGLAIYTWCEVAPRSPAPATPDGRALTVKDGEKDDGSARDKSSNDISNSVTVNSLANGRTNSAESDATKDAAATTTGPAANSGKNTVVGLGLRGSTLRRSVGVGSGTVLRQADDKDVQQLHSTQAELERRAVDVCAQRVLDHGLPMVIVDAEYQYDKKKLTFYYEAQQRMDFRELVRDLYKTFRARIWMEAVEG